MDPCLNCGHHDFQHDLEADVCVGKGLYLWPFSSRFLVPKCECSGFLPINKSFNLSMSRALILLDTVVLGLRDPIRHVKYPDCERCARCGVDWPSCPNGAFDELREMIKQLRR